MKESAPFRFKQFSVAHGRSSMKVGVDAVLVGAWGGVEGIRGLDIGCGCGVIAMMAAQRNPKARITALDIHPDSVAEASNNFNCCLWSTRLEVVEADALEYSETCGNFDFILSNPPYFRSGIKTPETPKEKARHEAQLNPQKVVDIASAILLPMGTVTIILPSEHVPTLDLHGLVPEKICKVANKPGAIHKRTILMLRKGTVGSPTEEVLYLRDYDGNYSEPYRSLTKDFYLNF